jgi:hypothetical protein
VLRDQLDADDPTAAGRRDPAAVMEEERYPVYCSADGRTQQLQAIRAQLTCFARGDERKSIETRQICRKISQA